jgi:hypothetical protein
MCETRNAYLFIVGKPVVKRPYDRPKCGQKENIEKGGVLSGSDLGPSVGFWHVCDQLSNFFRTRNSFL